MVVKSEIKLIKNLQQKKYRSQNGLFVAEGRKTVSDLLRSSYKVHKVYSTEASILEETQAESLLITQAELRKMSGLQSPNTVLGVFHIPRESPLDFQDWILALDAVRDPGNLGTIIRLCDWYGIGQLVCSPDTVDCYNPKTLQATMGSIARVKVVYAELERVFNQSGTPVFGAFIGGEPVYEADFPQSGILLMGSEAHGISDSLAKMVGRRIGIPPFGKPGAESLNVAMATAILLHELRRPTRK